MSPTSEPGTGASSRAARPGALDRVALVLAGAIATFMFVRAHLRIDSRPRLAPALTDFVDHQALGDRALGWWGWSDQGRYVDAALAWAQGSTDPSHHWYLPGYPLLGALFARLTPVDPFAVPDLLCLLISLVLFSRLTERLAPDLPHPRAVGAIVFVLCSVAPRHALEVWVIPWTSTPEVALLLATLLPAADFIIRPRARTAALAAAACVAIAGFRPADAAAVALTVGGAMLVALLTARPGWRGLARCAVAAIAGAMLPLLVFGAAHVAVHGWQPGAYLSDSGRIGFEWRLLPWRWVTIMIDPRPVMAGHGLASVFWWILPGIAGLIACLLEPATARRRLHGCVAALLIVDIALNLAYRDLHPAGLWRYYNQHYFKWTLPFFGLYAVLLADAFARSPRRRAPAFAAALAVGLGLSMWRPELAEPTALPSAGTDRIVLPAGPPQLDEAILAHVSGTWQAVYFGEHELRADGFAAKSGNDFKAIPRGDETLVLALRPLGDFPATLAFGPGVTVERSAPPLLVRLRLVWGLPCWIDRPVCHSAPVAPHP